MAKTVSRKPRIKPEVWEELRKVSADYRARRNISRVFRSVEEANEALER